MASKRRNMFHKNKTQETTEKGPEEADNDPLTSRSSGTSPLQSSSSMLLLHTQCETRLGYGCNLSRNNLTIWAPRRRPINQSTDNAICCQTPWPATYCRIDKDPGPTLLIPLVIIFSSRINSKPNG
ncbi:hypothetical protein AAG570_001428 [Ranatra chinensis]|uniref:Uncharacterized protein n=1 Tax=Ranatra chinensis TaxID=642074 RepID=A0ABD0YQL8_9HEMI